MPQSPLAATIGTIVTGGVSVASPVQLDATRAQMTGQGVTNSLNITENKVVKATPGRIAKLSVTVAASAAIAVHDCATVATASAANMIFTVTPAAAGFYSLDFPCLVGIVVLPGASQTVSVSYS